MRADALTSLGDLRGVRVVAMDDQEDSLSLLRVVLETAGATVITFASPVTALAELAVVRPDVLMIDLGMPEMDGFEFIGRVRASPIRTFATFRPPR